MPNEIASIKLEPQDTMIVMDELWYTTSGAMKMMKIGATTLSKEISTKMISVFRHPSGNLFSPDAIRTWIANKTIKARK